LKHVELAVQQTLAEVKQWEQGAFQETIRRFEQDMAEIHRRTANEIADAFDTIGEPFKEMMDQHRSKLKSEKQVAKEAQNILDEYAADCSKRGYEIVNQYHKTFRDRFVGAANKSSSDLDGVVATKIRLQGARAPHVHVDKFLMAPIRAGFINFGIGGAVAYLPAAVVAGVGFPVLGALVGIAVPLIAAKHGFAQVRFAQFEGALAKLEKALAETAVNSRNAATRALQDLATSLNRTARGIFEAIATDTKTELMNRLREVKQAQQRTQEQAYRVVSELKPKLAETKRLHKELTHLKNNLKS
jgi:gas vesicle protein